MLNYYFSLPFMRVCIGKLDTYKGGKCVHLDFIGELCIVWVQYKNVTKAYRTVN